MGVVVTGAHEIRHPRVHDYEILASRVLAIQHPREQHAGVRHQVAAGLAHQRQPRLLEQRRHRIRERLGAGRLLVVVADAQPAPDVQRLDRREPRRPQRGHELEQLDGAAMIRLHVRDLRAQVHGEAAQREQRLRGDALSHAHDLVIGDAELRRLLAGLGVGVRLGRDVGIHADAEARPLLEPAPDRDRHVQLGGGLNVHEADADADRFLELGRRLADAREHDRGGIESGRERAPQLAHRDDVRSRPKGLQNLENADVAVGLHRVADAVRYLLERVVQGVVLRADQVGAVDVHGRPHALRDRAEQRGVEP